MTTTPRPLLREALLFGLVYFFIALIHLQAKLHVTPAWFDGTLERNHALLRAFQYTNNEQSRLLQYYLPEAIHRVTGASVGDSYVVQRWALMLATLLCFHFYLRRWFDARLAFGGVMVLAAVLPLSYMNDLQESAPLLLLTFLLGLWAIRDHRPWWYALVLAVGALNNETILILPAVYFFYNVRSFRPAPLLRVAAMTVLTCLPAYALAGFVRYLTRDRPHLGGAWHLPDNVEGLLAGLATSPLDWYQAVYLYAVFIFGALWVYAFLDWRAKALFLRRASLVVPLFVLAHLLTGIISEVRQMVPLAFIIVPLALAFLFPGAADDPDRSPQPPPAPDPVSPIGESLGRAAQ